MKVQSMGAIQAFEDRYKRAGETLRTLLEQRFPRDLPVRVSLWHRQRTPSLGKVVCVALSNPRYIRVAVNGPKGGVVREFHWTEVYING